MNCSTGHAFQSSETIHRIVDLNKDTTCSLAPLWPPSKMHQQIHLAFDFTSEISCRTFWFWSLLLQNFADIVLFSSQSQQQLSTVSASATQSEGPQPQLNTSLPQATLKDTSQLVPASKSTLETELVAVLHCVRFSSCVAGTLWSHVSLARSKTELQSVLNENKVCYILWLT